MIVDRIGVSQIQAQTQAKPAARGTALRFDSEPVEPIKPVKTPTRDATAESDNSRAQRQNTTPQQAAEGGKNASAPRASGPRFTLDGQIPATVKSPSTIEEQSFSSLPGDVLAQQMGGAVDSSTFIPSGGGRGLARQRGADLYATIQQTTATPSVQTRDNLDFWSDGVVAQRHTPINMYA